MESQQSLGGGARGFIPLKAKNIGGETPTYKGITSQVGWAFSPTKSNTFAGEGFTLAEVLITLGIIGVVAAMTLPTLIQNHQKQETIAKVQKIYTILNQALKQSELENGEFQYWDSAFDMGAKAYFEKYYKPYFKIAKQCKTYQDCGYKSVTPWSNPWGTQSTLKVIVADYRYPFYLTDGTLVIISVTSGEGVALDNSIYVDLNGGRGPNVYCKDFFIFKRTAKNGIQPNGYDLEDSELINSEYCGAKLMRDGWQIKDDYLWR